jgi:predicted nucleotidyltransferase
LLGRNVDLVTDGSLAPFARQSVEKDKKLVYERTN